MEAGEEEEEVEWELVKVSQGKTLPNWFRDINGTCRRSFAVDYFTGSPSSLSLSPSLPLSHYSFLLGCHTVHAALIWFLARLALCFAFGVSFSVISPLSPLSPLRHCPQVTVIDCCHWWKTLSTFLSPSLSVLLCLYLAHCCPQNALIVPHSQPIYITRDIPYS